MPQGSEYGKAFTGSYPVSVIEFPSRIDNPAPTEDMVANPVPIPYVDPGILNNLRLQRQQDEKLRTIFYTAFGGKGSPPPLTPVQRDTENMQYDIFEKALRAGYKELPDETGYFRPTRANGQGNEIPLRHTKEGKPYLDPLYSKLGVA